MSGFRNLDTRACVAAKMIFSYSLPANYSRRETRWPCWRKWGRLVQLICRESTASSEALCAACLLLGHARRVESASAWPNGYNDWLSECTVDSWASEIEKSDMQWHSTSVCSASRWHGRADWWGPRRLHFRRWTDLYARRAWVSLLGRHASQAHALPRLENTAPGPGGSNRAPSSLPPRRLDPPPLIARDSC